MCHVTQGSQGKGHHCHFRCHFCDDTCTVQMPLKGRILTVKLQPQNTYVCYFQPLQCLLLHGIDRKFILLIHQSNITLISSIVFCKFVPFPASFSHSFFISIFFSQFHKIQYYLVIIFYPLIILPYSHHRQFPQLWNSTISRARMTHSNREHRTEAGSLLLV